MHRLAPCARLPGSRDSADVACHGELLSSTSPKADLSTSPSAATVVVVVAARSAVAAGLPCIFDRSSLLRDVWRALCPAHRVQLVC